MFEGYTGGPSVDALGELYQTGVGVPLENPDPGTESDQTQEQSTTGEVVQRKYTVEIQHISSLGATVCEVSRCPPGAIRIGFNSIILK